MHNYLINKLFNPKQHNKKTLLPSALTGGSQSQEGIAEPKSAPASPRRSRSREGSSLQLSKVSSASSASTGANMSYEELDCFRSMRGTSATSTTSLTSAMSSDAGELTERLRAIRQAGERQKKVFDRAGQGYSILVTHEEVRVCHVDEKGEYHYRHLPLPAPTSKVPMPTASRSRRNSSGSAENTSAPTSRAASADRNVGSGKAKKQPRRQVVQDQNGRTLVDITANSVTVFHDGGVWRCHRMLGKIWDSDYASHLTARMPRAWSRRPSETTKARPDVEASYALDADELARNGWDAEESAVADNEPVELLLCSNTPGERGTAPQAFKSFYHDL